MTNPSAQLATLRALRDAETDPARRATLDAAIARLEAEARVAVDGNAQVGLIHQGDVGGNINAPIIQPGASGVVADTVHQHFYPQPDAGADVGTATVISFDLRLHRAGEQLLVRATAPGLTPDVPAQPFVLPFALAAVAAQRGDAATWVKQARIVTRRRPEELRKARELGQLLFRHLFTGEILAAFRTRRAHLRPGEHLRVRLHLPPELATLPWELLNDPQNGAEGTYLALDPSVSLVRAVERAPQSLPPLVGPLHLQLVVASPGGDDYPALNVEREIRRIEAALRDPVASGTLILDPVIRGPNTRDQLRNRLRSGRGGAAHLLHVIAHGDMDSEARGAGVLIFEDAAGHPEPTSAEWLARLLHRQSEPTRLVLLNACLGALPATQDPTSSLAGALLQAGVPAVIAMQFDLADDAAANLARVFYAELAAGAPLDQAVGEARSELCESYPHRLDWLVPVLFLGHEDGALIARAPGSVTPVRQAAPPPPAPATPPAPAPAPAATPISATLRQEALIAFYTEAWERAEGLLARIVAADPQDSESRRQLAVCQLQRRLRQLYDAARELRQDGAWQAVRRVLDEIAAAQIDYPDPDYLHAWAAGQQRRDDHFQRAIAAAARDEWATVHTTLTPLLAEFPNDANARQLSARAERERFGPVGAQLAAGQFAAAVEVLRQRLEARADDRAALRAAAALIEDATIPAPAAIRVACGELLARYGDPRPGVCDLPPPMVPIAGGSFVIGISEAEYKAIIEAERKNNLASEAERWYKAALNSRAVTVKPFELARYPLTNAQFKRFIDAGGYNPSHPWWDEAGRTWLARDDAKTKDLNEWQRRTFKDRPEFWGDARFGLPRLNHPVVGLNWYEATAFCVWLTQHLNDGYNYRLPSEAEWEYAARGAARRPYPWGDAEPDGERANFNRTHGGTTAVGCFPAGASPDGLVDLTGNIWEWTRSEFRDYPYNSDDGREAGSDPAQKRFTLRGGSWANGSIYLRAARRTLNYPDARYSDLGLRLARQRA
ncbi:MAG: SUMF1/EgtB/PvdO family nonheme iron enzyme [Chloroflexales bacterium]